MAHGASAFAVGLSSLADRLAVIGVGCHRCVVGPQEIPTTGTTGSVDVRTLRTTDATMPCVEIARRFGADAYAQALESWDWLEGLAGMAPALTNAFGDVFLQAEDGSFWFLDTVGVRLDRVWSDAASLRADINTPAAQDEYLMVGLAQDAVGAGLLPGDDQVLSFKVPPVLGGELSTENLEVSDFVVSVNLAGQIHRQVRSLPPGAPITGITID